jgi:hypothetical protein
MAITSHLNKLKNKSLNILNYVNPGYFLSLDALTKFQFRYIYLLIFEKIDTTACFN